LYSDREQEPVVNEHVNTVAVLISHLLVFSIRILPTPFASKAESACVSEG